MGKYIVKLNFSNGEKKTLKYSEIGVWKRGELYTGEQADALLAKGLIEVVPDHQPVEPAEPARGPVRVQPADEPQVTHSEEPAKPEEQAEDFLDEPEPFDSEDEPGDEEDFDLDEPQEKAPAPKPAKKPAKKKR
jgi:hypothetical protein